MLEKDVEQVAEFLHRIVQVSLTAQKEAGSKKLADFEKAYTNSSNESYKLVADLKQEVMKFATSFPLPGVPNTVSPLPPSGSGTFADPATGRYQATRGCQPLM